MSEPAGQLFVVEITSGKQLGPVTGTGGDIVFPSEVRDGWSMVLDCRHEPYNEKPLTEVIHFAHHIGKDWILVPGALLEAASTPTVKLPRHDDDED
jgi:hypothetical protein